MGRKDSTVVPLRAVIGVLGFLGIVFQYVLKVTLSVAIGGMVTHTTGGAVDTSTCPLPDGTSTGESITEEGEFDWDDEIQGYILSSYYYGYAATNILGGYAAARFSARWVYGLGLLIAGVFTILGPVCAYGGPVVFMVSRIIVGIASGVVIPAMHVLFAKWFPEHERQRLTGAVFSANYLGTVLSMASSGTMVKNLGWTSVFYIYGGITTFLILPWVYFVYDDPESHPRVSEKEKTYIIENTKRNRIESSDKDPDAHDKKDLIGNPWPMILTSVPMWAHVLIMFATGWVNYTLLSELPTYVGNILHYDIDDAGLISALPYLFGWISCSVYSFLTQKFTEKGMRVINTMRIWDAVACVGSALCLLGVTLVDCDVTLIIVLFVLTMVCRCAVYGGSYMNHLYLFPRSYGGAAGLALTGANVSGIITPIVTSAFVSGRQTVQQWKYVFYLAMGISAVPYIFYLIFGTAEDQETPWMEKKKLKRKQQSEP
ncbi:sialin-like [Schistocerca cancellata]|uniref:sialin-like n=1 Tax=Schistocerca cancellata TaxID=274614 RepID=UPI0021173047|nr:sialin-like [Schistocerca cancellata]